MEKVLKILNPWSQLHQTQNPKLRLSRKHPSSLGSSYRLLDQINASFSINHNMYAESDECGCVKKVQFQNSELLLFELFFFFFFCFFGPHPWHMEVPKLGVEWELQPPAYTTVTATQDLSHICDLHHSSQQRWILSPLSQARDRTHNLMAPSPIRFH